MLDLTTGVRIPTDLDASFAVTVWDHEAGEPVFLLDDGTPLGPHEIHHEGQWYRIVCSAQAIPEPV